MRPITWSEYSNYLANKSKNTAPGKSGVRYAHIAYAPEHVQRSLLQLLNAAFANRVVFDSWRDELIYRTEKVPGDPDQMNKRPLKLQNVLRKMWIGMLKNRIVRVWYKHGLIDSDQHAYAAACPTGRAAQIHDSQQQDASRRTTP